MSLKETLLEKTTDFSLYAQNNNMGIQRENDSANMAKMLIVNLNTWEL